MNVCTSRHHGQIHLYWLDSPSVTFPDNNTASSDKSMPPTFPPGATWMAWATRVEAKVVAAVMVWFPSVVTKSDTGTSPRNLVIRFKIWTDWVKVLVPVISRLSPRLEKYQIYFSVYAIVKKMRLDIHRTFLSRSRIRGQEWKALDTVILLNRCISLPN